MANKQILQERIEKMTKQALALIALGIGDIEIVIAEDGGQDEVYGETLDSDEAGARNMIENAVYAHALTAETIHQGENNIDDLDPEAFGDIRGDMIDAYKGIFGTPAVYFRGDLVICIKTTTEYARNAE